MLGFYTFVGPWAISVSRPLEMRLTSAILNMIEKWMSWYHFSKYQKLQFWYTLSNANELALSLVSLQSITVT